MTANSVIAGVLIARFLGAESLGTYLVLIAAIQILIQLSGFSLHLANTYFVARDPEKTIPIAVNSILFSIISGSIMAAIVVMSAKWLLPGVPRNLALAGLAIVPFQLITNYIQNLFLAHGKAKEFNFIDVFNQSFVLINAIVALLLFGRGIWVLVVLNSISGLIIALLAIFAFYRFFAPRFPTIKWKGDPSIIWPMLSFSFQAFVLWACTFLVYRLDLIIVNYYRGPAEASVYAVATQYTMFLLLLPYTVSQMLLARVSGTEDPDGKFTARVARHTSLLLFAACLASVPGAFVIAAVYGREFESLPLLVWILLPGVFFVGLQAVLVQYFVGKGLPWFISIAWLITLVLNISLNVAGVPRYGAIGAALVSTLSYLAVSIAIFLFFVMQTKIGARSIFIPFADELKTLIR